MRRLLVTALLLGVVLGGSASSLADPASPSCTGTLFLSGKSIPLTYAYAVAVDDAEGVDLVGAGPQQYYVLVLSDRALPPTCVSNRYAPQSGRVSAGQMMEPLAKNAADAMNGIMLQIDKTKMTVINAQFLNPAMGIPMSIVGTEYPDVAKNIHEADGKLVGEASLPTATDTGLDKGPKKYRYTAQFSAPLVTEGAITENLTGPKALQSAPVATLSQYLVAAKEGDKATLMTLTDKGHVGYLAKPEVIKFFKDADPKMVATQLHRVVIRGDAASAVMVNTKPMYSTTTIHLVREGGAWKVCWP